MALTTWVLQNTRFFLLLLVIVAIAGLTAVQRLPWSLWPTVESQDVTVLAFYPSATPEQVETLLIHPIEMELKGINDLLEIVSTATEGVAHIRIRLDTDAPDVSRIVTEVQRAVDRAELPADLPDRPRVRRWQSQEIPAMAVALSGSTYGKIVDAAVVLERALRRTPGVARIVRSGWAARQIEVRVHPQALAQHQLTLDRVAQALARHNVNIPGGKLYESAAQTREFLLRISGEFYEPDEVADIIVRANDRGHSLRVRDVADVQWGRGALPVTEWIDGKAAIVLYVQFRSGSDWTRVAPNVRALVSSSPRAGVRVRIVSDVAARVTSWQRAYWGSAVLLLQARVLAPVSFWPW
jgi:multidrug efflux pump subunit AcrB